jgi:hypothetical protein
MLKSDSGIPTRTDKQTEEALPEPKSENIFSQELVFAIVEHFRLLLLGPLLVALVVYGIVAIMPLEYTSIAYLNLDGATAKSAEALINSSILAEKVLAKYPSTGKTPEAQLRYLRRNLHLVDLEPTSDRISVRMFRLELSDQDPRVAQSINKELIDAWLDTTKPLPVQRATLEAELERNKSVAAANSVLIERLQKEATNLILPNSLPGEIATRISDLISKRDQNLASIIHVQNMLAGVPRDVIISAPNLPIEPSWPKKGVIAVLAGLAAIPVLLTLVLLGRFVAPGLSVGGVFSRKFGRRRATLSL